MLDIDTETVRAVAIEESFVRWPIAGRHRFREARIALLLAPLVVACTTDDASHEEDRGTGGLSASIGGSAGTMAAAGSAGLASGGESTPGGTSGGRTLGPSSGGTEAGGDAAGGDAAGGDQAGGDDAGGDDAGGGVSGMDSAGATGGDETGGIVGTTCPSRAEDAAGNLVVSAAPANNYSFSSTLSFPAIAVRPDTELSFSWGDLTSDIRGRALDPMADIAAVELFLWSLSEEELQTKLNADELFQRDLAVAAMVYTENTLTSSNLFDFTSVGLPLEPCDFWPVLQLPNPDAGAHPECDGWETASPQGYDPASSTFTVILASSETLGQDIRMIQAFKLDPTSTNDHVEITDSSTHVEYSADLHSLQPTRIPAAEAGITVDWADMTVNALGDEFITTYIDEVVVASFSLTPEEMESQFLDLESVADEVFRGDAFSTDKTLSTLTNASGQPFTGIDGTHTWILALLCARCTNPAPWYLSTLTTCTP